MASRLAGVALALAMLLAALALSPGTAHAEDTPPLILSATVTPTTVQSDGDGVTITVKAIDDFSIFMAYADVGSTATDHQLVQLIPGPGPDEYSANFQLPPNATGADVTYYFNITITDTNGQEAVGSAGEVTVLAAPPFDEAPVVADPVLSPAALPAGGGAVTIQATATDDRAVSEVYATVTLPGGGTQQVALGGIGSSRYEGTFVAPANAGAAAAVYAVEVTALDDIGQPGTLVAGDITVAGRPAPPPSQLVVLTGPTSTFGSVVLGRTARQWIVVRNAGRSSTGAIKGVVRLASGPFRILAGGGPFVLRPGQAKALLVAFRPTALGAQTGSLAIVRGDGAQPGLAVTLLGRGVRR